MAIGKTLTLYKHVVTVTVITPEGSPDAVIAQIEDAVKTRGEIDAEATVTPEARQATPYQRVPAGPDWPGEHDRQEQVAYWTARDQWLDTLPSVKTFKADGRA